MSSRAPLIPEQRRRAVLDLLKDQPVLSTREVADVLGVSHMTVRRDIAQLESERLVTAVPGGMRLGRPSGQEPPTGRRDRAALETTSKRSIALAAATLLRDDTFVYLDAGTTCQAVVPHLAELRGLTVVTADLHIAVDLLEYPHIRTVHVGGVVDTESASTGGTFALSVIRRVDIDLAFVSTGSWSLEKGVTTPELEKVELKNAVLGASARSVLLADSSKFGAVSRFQVAPLDRFSSVVTDAGIGDAVEGLREAGVDVSVA